MSKYRGIVKKRDDQLWHGWVLEGSTVRYMVRSTSWVQAHGAVRREAIRLFWENHAEDPVSRRLRFLKDMGYDVREQDA